MNDLAGPLRVPFLVLTPACVSVGLGTAFLTTGGVNLGCFLLAVIGAVAAHISVNALNEYSDFKSGLDFRTRPTPFSGGSGTLPKRPELARVAFFQGVIAALIVIVIGLYFIGIRGWGLLPLGVLGLVDVIAYTPWLTHYPFACLVAPGLGFGPLMVMGTHYVLTGDYAWPAFWASLVPFFLVSDLLLLNQFPDVEADRTVGRRHFPLVIGRRKSSLIYAFFLFMNYIVLILGVWKGCLPRPALLGLLTFVLAVPTALGVYRNAEAIDELIPFMRNNVLITILTPVLLAVGLIIGGL